MKLAKILLFLAKAYAESDLNNKGIKLCVTGKLKGDDYSKALKKIVSHEPGIILTGYVDESSKLDLYLNALGLLSPSLVEGFGIPVLDGACLGMPTIASDCESHLEIQSLHDFSEHVLCLDTLDSREWAAALQAVAGRNRHLADHASQNPQKSGLAAMEGFNPNSPSNSKKIWWPSSAELSDLGTQKRAADVSPTKTRPTDGRMH